MVSKLEIMGALSGGGIIVFGDEGAEPLLGVTALGSARIKVNPQNQRLKQLPAVRLRGFLGTLPLKTGAFWTPLRRLILRTQSVEKINRQSAHGCFIRTVPGCGGVVSGGCRSAPRGNRPPK